LASALTSTMRRMWRLPSLSGCRGMIPCSPSLQRLLWDQRHAVAAVNPTRISSFQQRFVIVNLGDIMPNSSPSSRNLMPWVSRAMSTDASPNGGERQQSEQASQKESTARDAAAKHEAWRRAREEAKRAKNMQLAMYLGGATLFSIAMTYASVPLYRLFCQHTGFGGTVKTDNVSINMIFGDVKSPGHNLVDSVPFVSDCSAKWPRYEESLLLLWK
jgi:hypothetical protein